MGVEIKLTLPEDNGRLKDLRAGDRVLISGVLFTARDAAHKILQQKIDSGDTHSLHWLKGACIYYTGPCPAPPDKPIGSCGPTTSGRMDVYTPKLLDFGVRAMIGKGSRNAECVASMVKNGAVYFAAIGGAGAFYSRCVKESRVFDFAHLLSEAVHKLRVEDFPVVVATDSTGASIYRGQ